MIMLVMIIQTTTPRPQPVRPCSHRYPEEPADTVLPAVGTEGNRNDVWWSANGADWHELKVSARFSAAHTFCKAQTR